MSDPQRLFNIYKFKHFYKNKYLISLFGGRRYTISYNYKYKCLWFRTPKVGSRSINQHFMENTPDGQYIYSSPVSYVPSDFDDYFKFAFVRNPTDRFISCWKDKVLNLNMFGFDDETHIRMKELSNFISWVEGQDLNSKADEHIRTQHSLIDLNNLNFIGRLESFDRDLQTVADAIGMPLNKLHKKNASGDRKIEISDEDRVRIRNLYDLDYRLFYPHLIEK